MRRRNIVREKSFHFAGEIIRFCDLLYANKEFVLSNQLLRAGTSIGANIAESSAAVSSKDFTNKIAIANKEARETLYWLELLLLTNKGEKDRIHKLKSEVRELERIMTSIIKTMNEKAIEKT